MNILRWQVTYLIKYEVNTDLLLLKENGNKIFIVSFERDSKAICRSLLTVTIFLYLFYFGRYSHLNQRTVDHLGLIFSFINYVLVTSQTG